jgi:hypothetical protein
LSLPSKTPKAFFLSSFSVHSLFLKKSNLSLTHTKNEMGSSQSSNDRSEGGKQPNSGDIEGSDDEDDSRYDEEGLSCSSSSIIRPTQKRATVPKLTKISIRGEAAPEQAPLPSEHIGSASIFSTRFPSTDAHLHCSKFLFWPAVYIQDQLSMANSRFCVEIGESRHHPGAHIIGILDLSRTPAENEDTKITPHFVGDEFIVVPASCIQRRSFAVTYLRRNSDRGNRIEVMIAFREDVDNPKLSLKPLSAKVFLGKRFDNKVPDSRESQIALAALTLRESYPANYTELVNDAKERARPDSPASPLPRRPQSAKTQTGSSSPILPLASPTVHPPQTPSAPPPQPNTRQSWERPPESVN